MNSPLPPGPPQTSWLHKVDHYFLPLLKTSRLILEPRPNLLKEPIPPTSSGATSLPTAWPPLPLFPGPFATGPLHVLSPPSGPSLPAHPGYVLLVLQVSL